MRAAALVVALALVLAVRGGGGGDDVTVARTVPDGLVPDAVPTGELAMVAYDDPEVEDAFRPTGARPLADDAAVWQVRDGSLLVGALQVVALADRADPAELDDLRSMVGQAIPGTAERFDVEGVEVFAGRSGERQLFCWFAQHLMVFLQLKAEGVDGEEVVSDLVRHQVAQPSWESLPPLTEEDEL